MDEKQWDALAEKYDKEIVSPFSASVNPLFEKLEQLSGKDKAVAEFGCGFFRLNEQLSKLFKDVHASDFSSRMVETARKRSAHLKNVRIEKEDITALPYQDAFDVVISVNSLLMPSHKDRKEAFSNLFDSIKPGGSLLLILPSMEAVLYHGMLLLEQQRKRNSRNPLLAAKRKFEIGKYDLFLGNYTVDGEVQKFYYRHEIRYLLKKAGFEEKEISKVMYSWDEDVSDYEPFPKEEPLWDWFIHASKPDMQQSK